MNDLILKLIWWKEEGKWNIRHGDDAAMIRVLQKGVNIGHDMEQEWRRVPEETVVSTGREGFGSVGPSERGALICRVTGLGPGPDRPVKESEA